MLSTKPEVDDIDVMKRQLNFRRFAFNISVHAEFKCSTRNKAFGGGIQGYFP